MANLETKVRFLQSAGGEVSTMPELPKMSEKLKSAFGGEIREELEKFEKDLHRFLEQSHYRRNQG